MNLNRQVQLYKKLFSKSFFFDKFLVENVYQFPKFNSLDLKFFLPPKVNFNKVNLCKLIFLFYLLTGQKPQLLLKSCNTRSVKHKKVIGLFLTIHQPQIKHFFDFLVCRQLALAVPIFQLFLVTHKSNFNFKIVQKVQDDDILFQVLKISDIIIRYQICLKSTSLSKAHLQSILIDSKIPCKK